MAALFNSARYIILYLLLTLGLTSCGFVDSGGEGLNEPPSVSSTDLTADEQEIVKMNSREFVSDDFGRVVAWQWTQKEGEPVTNDQSEYFKAYFSPFCGSALGAFCIPPGSDPFFEV